MSASITLYTFPVSHFAEKVRWLLDYSGINFHVVNWVPVLHAPAAYLKSGKRTVPFIVVANGTERFVVHDSTAIIEWVNQSFRSLELIPDDMETYRDAMAFEERADSVGEDVIRYMYAPMVEQREDFIQVWGWGARPIYRQLLRVGFPLVKSLLRDHIDFSAEAREAGLTRLHTLFGELDQQLEDGQPFLLGDRFSIADISMASLLAPVYAPDTHPVYASRAFRNTLVTQQSEFERYSSFAWMKQIYADHRQRRAALTAVYTA